MSGHFLPAAGWRLGSVALVAATLAVAGAVPASAQVYDLEWSLRLGAGAAGVEGRSGPAGLVQSSITSTAGERLRVGPVLELIGIADLEDCPLVPGADCASSPSPLVAASLRFQRGRAGPYLFAQPSLFFWEQDDGDRFAPGAGLGLGFRGEGMSGFNAELGVSTAFTESPAAIVTLTVGFAMEVRPPSLPTSPVPGLPPRGGRGNP